MNRFKKIFINKKYRNREIDPDEVLLDSRNLPGFDTDQFEGRIIKPVSKISLYSVFLGFLIIVLIFVARLWDLQIANGNLYAERSAKNTLHTTSIFAKRGSILDRNGTILTSSEVNPNNSDFLLRKYINLQGFSLLLGYVQYPAKDKNGVYFRKTYLGKDGIEKTYDYFLSGTDGLQIVEKDAFGNVVSQNIVEDAKNGNNIDLTIDSRIQSKLFQYLKGVVDDNNFKGGSAVIMDVKSGEILAMTSYPEYDSNVMTDGKDVNKINSYLNSKENPFLNRNYAGVLTPGSIMKPYVAIGALTEKTVDPLKIIISTGSISIPNPFDPEKKSIFMDWRANGPVDMRRALAFSSNVYFYEVGGGFEDVKGLGITNIEKYMRMFGFGSKTGFDLSPEVSGTVPNPDWKKANFNGEEWIIGDTYNSSIGQYGFQITPIQAVRAVSAIANGGWLLKPYIVSGDERSSETQKLPIADSTFKVIKEGMRQTVTLGTAPGLQIPGLEVAAKTGTAQIGTMKTQINSTVIGFFPYENPRYAFVTMIENGPDHTPGAVHVIHEILDWMSANTPEYLK